MPACLGFVQTRFQNKRVGPGSVSVLQPQAQDSFSWEEYRRETCDHREIKKEVRSRVSQLS